LTRKVLGWHFLPEDRHTRWNRQIVAVGQTITYDGPLKLCRSGLHASVKAIDALQYAPGSILGRVELSGTIIDGGDKCVATKRICLAMNDATETLYHFARWCALSVDQWDAPDVVLDYLMTGDEGIRAAAGARATATATAGAAAWNAARAAAGDRAAAWNAAWDAARDAQEHFLTQLFRDCVGHK
jgi:hypothetical protein